MFSKARFAVARVAVRATAPVAAQKAGTATPFRSAQQPAVYAVRHFSAPPVKDLHSLQYKLLPRQAKATKWLYALHCNCELFALLLRRKHRTPRETTRFCYEHFFDPLCADTGIWPDYTEGHYPNGDETYEEAKLKQFDFILNKTGASARSKILDLGCGNGKLLAHAQERGCDCHGITVSRAQQANCKHLGLMNVKVLDFQEIENEYPPGYFDVVIMNGSAEHFVTEEDQIQGKGFDIRQEFFSHASYLLKPSGKVFITSIHLKYPTDVKESVKSPLEHRIGSYYFFFSVIVSHFSGWYPLKGDYESAASSCGFKLTFERDATADYYTTSRLWSRRLRDFMKSNKGFMFKFLAKLFWKDPRYFFNAFLFLYYDVWVWQFRPAPESPMWHRWLMFEKETKTEM